MDGSSAISDDDIVVGHGLVATRSDGFMRSVFEL